MIYTNNDVYKIKFFYDFKKGRAPVKRYLSGLPEKERAKVLKYIEYLRQNQGVLDEPYSRHIKDKIRELRVDFASNRHRILFFTFVEKKIILLHAFLKRTQKTPQSEIVKAMNNYYKILSNNQYYVD